MITRRKMLTGSAVAVVASATPAAVGAAPPRCAWERARELARELANVLDEGDDVFDGPGGQWSVRVLPKSRGRGYPVCFSDIDAQEQRNNVTPSMQKALDDHTAAQEVLRVVARATDSVVLGREPSKAAERRFRKASCAERSTLLAICAYVPGSRADARAKAQYLMPFTDWGQLSERHLQALVMSGAG